MTNKTTPYGSWSSPISTDFIVADSVGLGQIALDGATTYWLESRPSEAGRVVIVRHDANGQCTDMTPAPFNVRSSVHEYGGGAFTVHNNVLYFINFDDQGLYRQSPGSTPQALSVAEGLRYADLLIDHHHKQIICICEDHRGKGEPKNTMVAISLINGQQTILAQGADFYASPTLSPDGRTLAWLCWRHPNMPWDGTELWLANIQVDGCLEQPRQIAGGPKESIFQPQWGPDGTLYFVSDTSGWWNLYCWRSEQIQALQPMAAEFGLPQWVFGMSTYGLCDDGRLVCAYRQQGSWKLALLHNTTMNALDLPYSDIDGVHCQGQRTVFLAGSATEPTAVIELDLNQGGVHVLRRASSMTIDPGYLSIPEAISFPSTGGRTAHGFFYPPTNSDHQADEHALPPLLVKSHGGPTAATSTQFNLGIQYWTSRGFALVDVNYGGSTGYGRDYQRQLHGQWGILDVDDCVAAAQYLIASGRVDGERCAIRGNSAGGYTTLAALTFRDQFRAGASYYGISDLASLAEDTHKFESRYTDRLIGPYPQEQQRYRDRSPIEHVEELSAPCIFFQGLEDKVVPPNQAEMMVEALRHKGIAVAYVPFEGERHGFRQAKNIKRALEAELYFYAQIFGFSLVEPVKPVAIDHLKTDSVHSLGR